jgi:hypothetical protein
VPCVSYGNGVWAIGQYNTIYRSTDTVTWSGFGAGTGTSSIASVAYGNGVWIATAPGGIILKSTDAMSWSARTSNLGSNGARAVAYGNNTFVAAGDSGQARRSAV